MNNKSIILSLCAAALIGLTLAGCTSAPQPTATAPLPSLMLTITVTPSATDTPQPTESPTPDYTLTWAADNLANPSLTPTGTPVMDTKGSVTWHPQHELISFYESGGDGVSYYLENFGLYWDGTLMQPSNSELGAPYVSKLSNGEICKLLNTAQKSGFFGRDEPQYDRFPFSGAGSESIAINGWESNTSSAQILGSAIAGRPYYDNLFCRNCPIPSEETIIRPALANMYFLLSHYVPQRSQIASVEKLHVTFIAADEKATPQAWPLKSISLQQLWKDCNKEYDRTDSGMVVEGEIAREMMQKIKSGQVFSEQIFSDSPYTKITYSAIWPAVPDVPANATLTCNVNTETYPLLPLNPQNQFWYYAPNGQWAAERVEPENKMRVVNITGYEKFYQYDAKSFGQPTIRVYPRYWSADGQFFYVNILPEPKNYNFNISLINSIGLQKIDVKNEKVSYVFIGTQKESFAYSFSHGGKQIAYIRQGEQPLKLVVVDAISGEEKSAYISNPLVPTDQYVTAGSILWPYNDDKLYLVATYEQNGKRKSHILLVDPVNPAKMQVIYEADGELKLVGTGDYPDICPLISKNDTYCAVRLDTETGEIQK